MCRVEHSCGPGWGKGSLGAAVEGAQGLSGPALMAHARRRSTGHGNYHFPSPQTHPYRPHTVNWVLLSRQVAFLFHGCVQHIS